MGEGAAASFDPAAVRGNCSSSLPSRPPVGSARLRVLLIAELNTESPSARLESLAARRPAAGAQSIPGRLPVSPKRRPREGWRAGVARAVGWRSRTWWAMEGAFVRAFVDELHAEMPVALRWVMSRSTAAASTFSMRRRSVGNMDAFKALDEMVLG